ncbi:hypothetical protein EPUS_09244 [Endocarpon pusillum Z07020]|uniref:Uncharacterized protein n=1 Tax=Endocarpon pusillum (strain Z07020 / HMAS-L-300199) TaxID=1263415 RepID=U1GBC6_ENDPU|nr:uncharacterized protein EPUS_09244 [Endocarpon pusillum Z07020]ERF69338.1 hypothetical protein EPUS_09244 [Endocarpon pusillum Z07020]
MEGASKDNSWIDNNITTGRQLRRSPGPNRGSRDTSSRTQAGPSTSAATQDSADQPSGVLKAKKPESLLVNHRENLPVPTPWVVADLQGRIGARDTPATDPTFYNKTQFEIECALILHFCKNQKEYQKKGHKFVKLITKDDFYRARAALHTKTEVSFNKLLKKSELYQEGGELFEYLTHPESFPAWLRRFRAGLSASLDFGEPPTSDGEDEYQDPEDVSLTSPTPRPVKEKGKEKASMRGNQMQSPLAGVVQSATDIPGFQTFADLGAGPREAARNAGLSSRTTRKAPELSTRRQTKAQENHPIPPPQAREVSPEPPGRRRRREMATEATQVTEYLEQQSRKIEALERKILEMESSRNSRAPPSRHNPDPITTQDARYYDPEPRIPQDA